MLLILVAIFLVSGAIFLLKRVLKTKAAFQAFSECMILGTAIISACALVIIGIIGVCIGKSEYELIETNDLVGVKQGESTYVFLDEENIGYYVDGSRIQVVNKNGVDASGSCSIVIGDYDKIYVEKYNVDYKMNILTFNLMNGSEYKIYIPQSMASE